MALYLSLLARELKQPIAQTDGAVLLDVDGFTDFADAGRSSKNPPRLVEVSEFAKEFGFHFEWKNHGGQIRFTLPRMESGL
jgi:hypothetical protein